MADILDQIGIELLVAGLVFVLGAWLVYRGVWSDRSRGRRRCPKCWYDLRGSPSMTCPECGHETRRERKLYKNRRRWRVIIVGLILLLPSGYVLNILYGWAREQPVLEHINAFDPSSPAVSAYTEVMAPTWLQSRLPPRLLRLYERVTSIEFANATDEDIARLAPIHHLKSLTAQGPLITDASMVQIAKMMNLRELHLDNTRITDAGLQRLSSLVRLERLFLSNTDIGDKGIAIISRLAKLKVLDLADTHVTDVTLTRLHKSCELASLNLTGTGITDAGLASLAGQTGLLDLELEFTAITDDGMQYVRNMRDIRFLYLSGTKVTSEGLRQIKDLPKLAWLSLSGPALTEEGVDLLRQLPAPTTIFTLDGQSVGDDEVKRVATIPTIVMLWLRETSATDACLAFLQHVPTLNNLMLERCPYITQQGIDQFKKAAPKVGVGEPELSTSRH